MRAFLPADLPTVNTWRAARGLPPVPGGTLPSTGYLVEGVAAGFLYLTDAPSVALLDGFVSCPDAPLRARQAALAELVERLLHDAKASGAVHVLGLTSRRSMERLVTRLGFHDAGTYRLMTKEV